MLRAHGRMLQQHPRDEYVVSTKVGRAPEIIRDGANGRLAPVADIEALAGAILELYRRPQERYGLGAAARETIVEHYSLEAMLSRLEALYLELWEKNRK